MSIYPPTGTLEIKNATLKIPVVDLQYTSNTAKLEANSNVVTEFSRSKKLIKYPRVALTSAAATSPGYEEYIATASSSYNNASNYDAWAAFNGNVEEGTQEGWLSISGSYDNATPSLPVTSGSNAELFNSRYGDWLNIKLPNKIVLSKLHTYPRTGNENPGVVRDYEHPDAGYLYGSNDGFSTFQEIYSFDGVPVSTTFRVPTIHTVNATKAYNEYRFQVTKLKGQRTFTAISEMELFGVPEYDPEAHGTDVTVKSYPNVPNTDWLEVYYDAKGLADGAVSTTSGAITGLGGTTNNGTAFGDPQVSNGAFVFDGSGDYIESGLTINAVGTPQHTFSLWVKPSTGDMDDTNNHFLCVWGDTTAQNSWSGLALTGGKLLHAYHASGKYTSDVLFTTGNWHHIVVVIKSTIETVAIDRDADFYVDGVLYSGSYSTLGSQAGNSAYYLNWGSGTSTRVRLASLLSGGESSSSSIANFRLFNRALTSDEIYQLYAYQKEYFGHGDLSMTLKAGRLGIGTSEPRVALDVRGEIRAVGSMLYLLDTPLTHEWHWSGSTSATTGSEQRIHYNQFPPNCRAIYADVFLPMASAGDHGTHILGESWKNIGRTWTDGRSLTTATTNNARPSTYMTTGVTQGAKVVYIGQPSQSDNFEYYYGNWWQSLIIPLGDGNNLYHGRTGYGGTHGWIYVYTKGYYV